MHVHVVYRLVWALIISAALCTIKQSKVILHRSWVRVWQVSFFFFEVCCRSKENTTYLFSIRVCIGSFLKLPFPCSKLYKECVEKSEQPSQTVTWVRFCERAVGSPRGRDSCEVWKKDQPDGVAGERHSERLQAVEELLLGDAWTQLVDVFLGRQRELMLAVSESPLWAEQDREWITATKVYNRWCWCEWKHSSIIRKAAKIAAVWCVGQSLVFLISREWQRAKHSLSMLA